MVLKYQVGGAAPTQEGAPAPAPEQGGGQDQIMQIASQILQELGPEGAMALAQAIVEMVQGGGVQPTAPQPVTMQRKGGRLVRVK